MQVPQRMLLFLNLVNYPFNVDWDKPEVFGFSPNKARNLTITTSDGVRLGAWHILPSAYYRKVSEELEKAASSDKIASPKVRKGSLVTNSIQLNALLSRPVFLYFHGNAGNRASPKRIETYRNLSERLNVNVFAIDYRGFGNSEGTPSEEGLTRDARAAWDYLIGMGVPHSNIVLLGHSLGTGVATRLARDLAADNSPPPRGLILQAPYASIPDVAFEFRVFQALPLLRPVQVFPVLENYLRTHIVDKFDTLSHVSHLSCPVLLIHGVLDREIPNLHSRMIFHAAAHTHKNQAPPERHEVVKIIRGTVTPAAVAATSAKKSATASVDGEMVEVKSEYLESCVEEGKSWALEGKRWISERPARANESEIGVVRGPTKVMLCELYHAHHNNVQSQDLTYDSIEAFLDIDPEHY